MYASAEITKAVRLDSRRSYELARLSGVNVTVFSRIINQIEQVKPDDPRVLRIGNVLGLSDKDCFQG